MKPKAFDHIQSMKRVQVWLKTHLLSGRFQAKSFALWIVCCGIIAWLAVFGLIAWDTLRVHPVTPTVVQTVSDSISNNDPRATMPPIVMVVTITPTIPTATPILPTVTPLNPVITSSPSLVPPSLAPSIATTVPPTVAVTIVSNMAANNTTSNACAYPSGWSAYSVEPGDTLFGFVLGSKGTLTVDQIMAGNCLNSKTLAIGQVVYLPSGVAENSPKVDDSIVTAQDGNNPSNPSRAAQCPCKITVRAGWRVEQIAAVIDQTPVSFTGNDFLATVRGGANADFSFLATRPAGKSLEGFMYPGTYTLENSTSALQFRDMMLASFGAAVSGQVQADAAARGLTFWQAVVLASIIQRESYAPSEQKLVASVFHNRLKANKGLAATVTISYALGVSGNWWPRVKSVNVDSPYNTYLYQGLTPAPIANPTLDAILAAVYPAETNYQYFSGKCGGGGNFYAATFEEFKQGLNCQ